jgi:hypothetical protein
MSDSSDKLARTRLAIVEHVYRKENRKETRHEDPAAFSSEQTRERERNSRAGSEPNSRAGSESGVRGRGNWRRAKRAARSYWRHHPARMGVQMAAPLLSRYARSHPLAYLGIAAAAGALLMVARPWRLISVTGVLMALAKSPQVAGLVMSTMSGWDDEEEDEA